jgi:hypothetical protein
MLEEYVCDAQNRSMSELRCELQQKFPHVTSQVGC